MLLLPPLAIAYPHESSLRHNGRMRTSENASSRDCLESRRRILDRLCLVLQEGEMGHFRPLLATRYTPNRGLLGLSRQSLEGGFSEVRRLVLRRSRLGTLFEGAVHLLKPLLRVGLKATAEQGNEQTLERFSLDEPNTVLLQRLDGEHSFTIEHTRHQ